jgi:hypothetical protein
LLYEKLDLLLNPETSTISLRESRKIRNKDRQKRRRVEKEKSVN